MPVLDEVGIDPGEPTFIEIHNIIKNWPRGGAAERDPASAARRSVPTPGLPRPAIRASQVNPIGGPIRLSLPPTDSRASAPGGLGLSLLAQSRSGVRAETIFKGCVRGRASSDWRPDAPSHPSKLSTRCLRLLLPALDVVRSLRSARNRLIHSPVRAHPSAASIANPDIVSSEPPTTSRSLAIRRSKSSASSGERR